jgi:hypothetical protein
VIRDGNSGRALPTLLRYRGAAQAEFLRSLRTLKALQAEQAASQPAPVVEAAVVLAFEPGRRRAGTAASAPDPRAGDGVPPREPNEPEPSAGPARVRPSEPERPGAAPLPPRPATEPNEPERSPAAPPARPQEPAERTPSRGSGTRIAGTARTGPGVSDRS